MAATIPFSIVRYFQSRVSALTGVALDLINSPGRKLQLGKAKLLHECCNDDLNVVMAVIDLALADGYILEHPSLAIVHAKVTEYLYILGRRKQVEGTGYLDRDPVVSNPVGGYLERDYQEGRKLAL